MGLVSRAVHQRLSRSRVAAAESDDPGDRTGAPVSESERAAPLVMGLRDYGAAESSGNGGRWSKESRVHDILVPMR